MEAVAVIRHRTSHETTVRLTKHVDAATLAAFFSLACRRKSLLKRNRLQQRAQL